MAELAEVETPKNAGFVQAKPKRNANQKRIEKEEAELKALIEGGEPEEQEGSQEEASNTEVKEEALSAEERSFKKRYSDLRSHLNKQSDE